MLLKYCVHSLCRSCNLLIIIFCKREYCNLVLACSPGDRSRLASRDCCICLNRLYKFSMYIVWLCMPQCLMWILVCLYLLGERRRVCFSLILSSLLTVNLWWYYNIFLFWVLVYPVAFLCLCMAFLTLSHWRLPFRDPAAQKALRGYTGCRAPDIYRLAGLTLFWELG